MYTYQPAVLAFEDGSVFRGSAFGKLNTTFLGEVVFNTSMTGYQEIITDPSYYRQIVTMTAPHIGNYGVCGEDVESDKPYISGLVVRELSSIASNWRSEGGLSEYLGQHGIPGIEGVDTRAITRRIRDAGVLKACIATQELSDEEAVGLARDWAGVEGVDLAGEISCKVPYFLESQNTTREAYRVVAFDFGAKRSIFEYLRQHGFDVMVVPASTTVEEVKQLGADAIFLSNGPGDPSALGYAHAVVRELMEIFPVFGICMGHQVITHALGASTYKLKFGHRGGNQPVKNLETGVVAITAQNHGYAVSQEAVEAAGGIVTEINLNDHTVAGLRHCSLPTFSVQYHPEASPGPHDARALFEKFYQMVAQEVCAVG